MRVIVIILISLFLLAVQFSLPGSYFFKFFIPNLVLVFLATAAFYLEFKELLFYTFITGFILDISSVLPFGFFLITYLTVGSTLYFLRQLFHETHLYSALIFTVLGTVLFYLLFIILLAVFSFLKYASFTELNFKYLTLAILPANLVANLGVAFFFFFFTKKLFKWLSYYREETLKR